MATEPSLIGRDQELRVLTDLIDNVQHRGAAIAVLGDPGIGKSSLLRAAASHGRDAGSDVLSVTGIEAEAHLPFAGLHQLLRPLLGATEKLPAPQRDALRAAFGTGPAGANDTRTPEPFMIALATLNALTDAAAQRPLLVVVDDMQWLDQPTQDALAFVARRIGSDPCVLIGVVRTGHDVAFAAIDLPQLNLGRLDEPDARELLARHAADLGYADRERILRDAAGNPLALVELPLALRSASQLAAEHGERLPHSLPVTARLERAFAARLADLPPLSRDALLVAAVNDADDLQEILAGTAALTGREVGVMEVEAAAAAGLVWFDDLRVHFRHPLVRAAIMQKEAVARRQAANAALADVLADEPYRRTWHRAQSVVGQDDEIADELEAAHAVPLRRGSVAEAIWALERSAQLTTDSAKRGRRLMLAAEHAFGLGRAELVDQLLARAARTSLSRLDQVRMLWLREIFNAGMPADADRVFALCDAALEAIDAGDSTLALNLLLCAGQRSYVVDTGPATRARVCEVARLADCPPNDPRLAAVLGLADPLGECQAVTRILASVPLESIADPVGLWLLGLAAAAITDPVRSVDFLGRAEAMLRQQGRLGLLSQVLTTSVYQSVEIGDWERAWAASEEGRRLAVDIGQAWDAGSQPLYATIVALRGDHGQAQSIAAEAERSAVVRRLSSLLACVQLARGYAYLSADQHTDAFDALRRLFDPADPAFHRYERFRGVSFLAEAAVRARQEDDARTVIAGLEAEAATAPAPILHRQLSYARAVLAADGEAEELFLAALSADLTRWPWLRARLELAFGQWLRRQHRSAEARRPLRSAQLTFDLIGARHWAETTRIELRAAGVRTQGAAPGTLAGLSALSAQELQIARLAAEGLSNREIGERLYLSHRTVGSHLYRIFPKLKVTTRAQLAALLGSQAAGEDELRAHLAAGSRRAHLGAAVPGRVDAEQLGPAPEQR